MKFSVMMEVMRMILGKVPALLVNLAVGPPAEAAVKAGAEVRLQWKNVKLVQLSVTLELQIIHFTCLFCTEAFFVHDEPDGSKWTII